MSPTVGTMRSRVLLLCLFSALIISAVALAAANPLFQPVGALVASDGHGGHLFGSAIDVSGDTAVIGAPGWTNTGDRYIGAAYVFNRKGQNWTERVRLTDANGRRGEIFGASVTLDDDTLAVGVPYRHQFDPTFVENSGAVVLFNRQTDDWTQGDTLRPDDLVPYNYFGLAVDLDNDTLIVGAPSYDADGLNEAAYVYRFNGTIWDLEDKLTASSGPRYFGAAVAVYGDVALVGATGSTGTNSSETLVPGEVVVFTRNGGEWSEAGTLIPAESSNGDNFGCAIDFDGQTAAIAACEAYGLPPDPGKAYVFVRDGSTWTQQAYLTPDVDSKGTELDSVALRGDRLVLGSPRAFTPGPGFEATGAAFVYVRSGEQWTLVQTLFDPAGQPQDGFGDAVALADTDVLVGAPDHSVLTQAEQGSVIDFRAILDHGYHVLLPVTIGRPAPSVPPDQILYTIGGTGNTIYSIRADGTDRKPFTPDTESAFGGRWSPDRKRIAYVRLLGSSAFQMTVVNADGSGKQAIPTPKLDMMTPPAWSPDGQTLTFAAYTKYIEWDIYVMGVDGSGLTNLTANLSGNTDSPTWSADGSHILFRHDNGTQSDLLLMKPDGSGRKNLTNDEFPEYEPDWSPDGKTILFYSSVNDKAALYTIPATGGTPELVLEDALSGRWSPDGKQIVFVGGGGGLFRVDANGKNVSPVDETKDAIWPDW